MKLNEKLLDKFLTGLDLARLEIVSQIELQKHDQQEN